MAKQWKLLRHKPTGSVKSWVDDYLVDCIEGRRIYKPEYYKVDEWEYIEPFEFEDELKVISDYKGQSAAGVILQSIEGEAQYYMTINNFSDLVRSRDISQGMIPNSWYSFAKKGSCISLVYKGNILVENKKIKYGVLF